jgi:cyclophilin family peptidyl-prolyl cis-trans isomerase
MKKVLEIGGIIILIGLIIYFVGTKPAEEKKETQVSNSKKWDKAPNLQINPQKKYTADIDTTDGIMKVELNASEVPNTVNNFVFLSKEKFYDNVVFHRIIKGFMIQSGDPTGSGMGGPGYQFNDEKITRDYKKGVMAMANSGPNTNGSQFFIMHADNTSMPKQYVIFGQINPTDAESMKILDAIALTPVEANSQGESSAPTEPVFIKTINITEQ